ncbi:hypothetical protein [Niveispirillum sp. KHB5.9]
MRQMETMGDEAVLLDRVEDAVLSVHPDLWLGALALVLAINWLA